MEFEVQKVYWGIIAVKGKGGGLGRGKPTAVIQIWQSVPAHCGSAEQRPPGRGVLCWVVVSRPLTVWLSHCLGLSQELDLGSEAEVDLKELTAGSYKLISLLAAK